MQYRDVACSHCLKIITRPDTLFHGKYTVDPYRSCALGCRYCDSSVDTVDIKVNAVEVLVKELEHLPRGRVILGSVHDPYQPVEEQRGLSRAILEVLRDHGFPCNILTKSPLVLRDLPLISSFDCTVAVSLLSTSLVLAAAFEPGVVSPLQRLDLVRTLRSHEINAGVALMPFLPLLAEPDLEATVAAAAEAHASFLLYKHLELKGEQRDRFLQILAEEFPLALPWYRRWYENAISPDPGYLNRLGSRIEHLCQKHGIDSRMATKTH